MKKTVVIHSGGLDSTVLLYYLIKRGVYVLPLAFDYGQKHVREISSAKRIWDAIGLEGKTIVLPIESVLGGNALTRQGVAVPDGSYQEENMKQTVVPNRNMIFLSIATAYAISEKANVVAYAAHAGDQATYPDCRTEFVEKMRDAIEMCDWRVITLQAPFVGHTKAQIVQLGAELEVPFGLTWSCYKGREKHCGKCGTCIERKQAFKDAEVEDETEYETD